MQTAQTSMHQNSLFNWDHDIQPTLSDRQRTVLNAIRYLGQATCSEVASYLNTFPHTISGRFGELRKKGLIEEIGNKIIGGRPHAICKAIEKYNTVLKGE